jgi:hypothetical protein
MASGDRRNKVVNNILNKVKILFRKGKFKSNKNTDPSSAITETETRTTTELEAPPHPTAAIPTLPSSAAAEDTGSSSARATGFPEPAPTTRTPIEHFWLCSTRAPIWNAALESLKTHHLRQYKELQELENKSAEPRSIQDMGKLLELKEETPESRAIVQRAKQYLPSLASVRGIAMTAAALDPHKIAPIVCASVFFTIEVRFPSPP